MKNLITIGFSFCLLFVTATSKFFLDLDSESSVGGYTPIKIDPNNLDLQNAVNQAMQTLQSEGQLSSEWIVKSIIKASTQVVNGLNYQLLVQLVNSNGQTMEMLWTVYQPTKGADQLIDSEVVEADSELVSLEKNMAGEYQPIPSDSDDPNIQIAINTLLNALSSGNGIFSDGSWSCTKVDSVEAQVVSGMNYNITAEFTSETTGKTVTVQFVVYIPLNGQPQLESYEIANKDDLLLTLEKIISFESAFGGYQPEPADANDPNIQIAINTLLNALSSGNGIFSDGSWSCTKVDSVEAQVVSGMNYNITAEFTSVTTEQTMAIQFVIYIPLNGQPQLESYEIVN